MKTISLKRLIYCKRFATDASVKMPKLKVTICMPHQIIMKDLHAHQVNLSTTEGDIGVLPGHVSSILQLRPGLIEILNESNDANTKKYLASGGFATINIDSSVQIAAIEAAPLEHIDLQLVKGGMSDLQKTITSSSSASEDIRAILQIQLEVYQALYTGLIKMQQN